MEKLKDENIENLTLLLIYLSSWDENPKKEFGEKPVLRAWKGFRFKVLEELSQKGLISDSRGSKSLYMTDKGIEKAREVLGKIRID